MEGADSQREGTRSQGRYHGTRHADRGMRRALGMGYLRRLGGMGAWSSFSRDRNVALTRLPLCSLMNRNHQHTRPGLLLVTALLFTCVRIHEM